jgi:hypothetical protein
MAKFVIYSTFSKSLHQTALIAFIIALFILLLSNETIDQFLFFTL